MFDPCSNVAARPGQASGRVAHSAAYVVGLAAAVGFQVGPRMRLRRSGCGYFWALCDLKKGEPWRASL